MREMPVDKARLERMHRRLAKRKDEEKQSLGPEACGDIKASVYVSQLSSEDLRASLRVECDKLWNQVLQAHSRLQQEQQSGIEYVHHIVAHTLNHPEARWLGRWYLGETFPFAHESQFLTIVSTLLWRTLVQATKNRIVQKWEEDPDLKVLPWNRWGGGAAGGGPGGSAGGDGGRGVRASAAKYLQVLEQQKNQDDSERTSTLSGLLVEETCAQVLSCFGDKGMWNVNEQRFDGPPDWVSVEARLQALCSDQGIAMSSHLGYTEREKVVAMQEYLVCNRQDHQLDLDMTDDIMSSLADNRNFEAGRQFKEVVEQCEDLGTLHRACMKVFEKRVRRAIYSIQETMEQRVPFVRELEQNQGVQLERQLNVSTTFPPDNALEHDRERHRPNERSMEFVFWFLKDRIAFEDESQWVLMEQVAHDLELHFKENPSHTQGESQGHEHAVLSREVGYVHAIKERMLDLAPHYEVYGSQDTQEMLTLIMKNGEESKDMQDDDSADVLYVDQPSFFSDDGNTNGAQVLQAVNATEGREPPRAFSVHGKGFDMVVNHHETLETRRRHQFYEKMDSFIDRATTWAAQMKVFSQLDALYREAFWLRSTLVRLLQSESGAGVLEEQYGEWLQNLVYWMEESSDLAEKTREAHMMHSRILVRRILCALWNKQHEERRYMDDDCRPENKVEDTTRYVLDLSHQINEHHTKLMQLRTGLMRVAQQVSASAAQSGGAAMRAEDVPDMALFDMFSIRAPCSDDASRCTDTGQNLQKMDAKFEDMRRLMGTIHEEAQHFRGLKEELRQVTGPADQCVGQYHEVVRDIAICMIRDEMLNKAKEVEMERKEREQEEQAQRAQEALLKDAEESEANRREEEKKAKKRAKEKERKEKARLEKERVREEEEAKKREEEERERKLAEEQQRRKQEKRDAELKRRAEEEEKMEEERQAQLKEQQEPAAGGACRADAEQTFLSRFNLSPPNAAPGVTSWSAAPAVPPVAAKEGTVARFKLVDLLAATGNFAKQLGARGSGSVFRGVLKSSATPIAVKKLEFAAGSDVQEAMAHMHTEVQVLSRIHHPNVVPLLGWSNDGEAPCLVYALAAGGSLQDRLACSENTVPLTAKARILVLSDVLRGLAFLHVEAGVMHRDVKSANVLIDTGCIGRIGDFGITNTRSVRDTCGVTATHLQTQAPVGTTIYMSPETLRGELSYKVDSFAFGLVIIEALTGLPVLNPTTDHSNLLTMFEEDMDTPKELLKHLDARACWDPHTSEHIPVLYNIAERCLEPRPKRRPEAVDLIPEFEKVRHDTEALDTAGAALAEAQECVVCMEQEKSHAFVSCGHAVVCKPCAEDIMTTTRLCPVCREPAEKVIKIFRS